MTYTAVSVFWHPSILSVCADDMACSPYFLVCLFYKFQGCNLSAYFDNTILGLAEGAQAA